MKTFFLFLGLVLLLSKPTFLFAEDADTTDSAARSLDADKLKATKDKLDSKGADADSTVDKTAKITDFAIPSDKKYAGEELKLKDKMEELFDASRRVNDKGEERAKGRAKIEGALDWEKVSQVCLGDVRWKKLSGGNRSQFKSLLKDVIVKTAFTRLDTFWNNTKYQFKKITVTGNGGLILTKFVVGKDSFELEYYFVKRNGTWLVYDISFDDLRYSVNINEQLESFLKEKPFPALLEKLKKRLDEIESAPKKS